MEKEQAIMLVLLVVVVIAGVQAVQLVNLENEFIDSGMVTGGAVARQAPQQAQKQAAPTMVGGC